MDEQLVISYTIRPKYFQTILRHGRSQKSGFRRSKCRLVVYYRL